MAAVAPILILHNGRRLRIPSPECRARSRVCCLLALCGMAYRVGCCGLTVKGRPIGG